VVINCFQIAITIISSVAAEGGGYRGPDFQIRGAEPLQQSVVVTSQLDHAIKDCSKHEEYTLMSSIKDFWDSSLKICTKLAPDSISQHPFLQIFLRGHPRPMKKVLTTQAILQVITSIMTNVWAPLIFTASSAFAPYHQQQLPQPEMHQRKFKKAEFCS